MHAECTTSSSTSALKKLYHEKRSDQGRNTEYFPEENVFFQKRNIQTQAQCCLNTADRCEDTEERYGNFTINSSNASVCDILGQKRCIDPINDDMPCDVSNTKR